MEETTGDNSHHIMGRVSTPSKDMSLMEKRTNVTATVPISKESIGKNEEAASVPLSAVVAVGGSFLFLNLLVFAGVYYQRKRILKLRECERNSANERNNRIIGNNKDSNVVQQAEGSPPGEPSHSAHITMNHKTQLEGNPLYTAISKPLTPTPGGYSYSALSQKSSSPMHNLASRPTHETSEDRSGDGPGLRSPAPPELSRSQEPDRSSPSGDNRNKLLQRANHQVTSNNAITIV